MALSNQFFDGTAFVNNRDGTITHHVFRRGIDSDRFTNGCEQICRADGPIGHFHAIFGCLADHLAAVDGATGQSDAPGIGEVIAAVVVVDLWRCLLYTSDAADE